MEKREGIKANSMYYVFLTDGIERTCGYICSDYNNAIVVLHEIIDELSVSGARGCILNDKLEVVYKTGGFVNDSKGRSNRADKT